jgi:hypothetical protein
MDGAHMRRRSAFQYSSAKRRRRWIIDRAQRLPPDTLVF